MLLTHEIRVDVLERIFVMHNQKVMDASDPQSLLKYLEMCIGTDLIQHEIIELEKEQRRKEECIQLSDAIQMCASLNRISSLMCAFTGKSLKWRRRQCRLKSSKSVTISKESWRKGV